MRALLFKIYIILSIIFSIIILVCLFTRLPEIMTISLLGLGWSLFGIWINSDNNPFTKETK